ncbi:hypothetical protein KBD87_02440 [Candidatus Saccharibacteria bacterium]|nr:hypothetical protein [Candidatus Saccharibacteria bacterium]
MNLTDRQQTGVWFIITGVLLVSFYVFSYAIVNWMISFGLFMPNSHFSEEQLYAMGGSSVVAMQLVSLTGIPFLLTGVAQVVLGKQKATKSSRKASK